MKKRSIRTYILVPTVVVLLAGLAVQALFMGGKSTSLADGMSQQVMDQAAHRYAAEFEASNERVMGALSAYGPMLLSAGNDNAGRDEAISMLRSYIKNAEGVQGVWVAWNEGVPGGTEGQAYQDEDGNFTPYVFKTRGDIGTDSLNEYADASAKQKEAAAAGNPYISDPYYNYTDGEKKLVYTLAVPITQEGEVVGTVGAEMDINAITQGFGAASVLGEGQAFLVSPSGLIAAHSDKSMVMHRFAYGADPQVKGLLVKGGYARLDGGQGADTAISAVVTAPSGTSRSWAVCVSAPYAAMVAPSMVFDMTIIVSCMAVALLVGFVLWAASELALKPLRQMNSVAHALAGGNFMGYTIQPDREDTKTCNEAELLKRDMFVMTNNMKRQTIAAKRMSKGDYTVEVRPRSGEDYLNIAMHRLVRAGNSIMTEINEAAGRVLNHAAAITDSSRRMGAHADAQADLAKRLGEEAASLKDKAQAKPDKTTKELSSAIKTVAEGCPAQVDGALKAMEEIKQATGGIGDVKKALGEMLEKTKSLAMKASVQAARSDKKTKKRFALLSVEIKDLFDMCTAASVRADEVAAACRESAEKGDGLAADAKQAVDNVSALALGASTKLAETRSVKLDKHEKIKSAIDDISKAARSSQETAGKGAAAADHIIGSTEALKGILSRVKLRGKRTNAPAGKKLEMRRPKQDHALMPPQSHEEFEKAASAS